jgi:hypothetical protein
VQVVDEQRIAHGVGDVQVRAPVGGDTRRAGARRRGGNPPQRAVEQLHDALAPAQHGDQPTAVVGRHVDRLAAGARAAAADGQQVAPRIEARA